MIISVDFKRFGVEAIVTDSSGSIVCSKSVPELTAFQDGDCWWDAACQAMERLKEDTDLTNVKSIGLSCENLPDFFSDKSVQDTLSQSIARHLEMPCVPIFTGV